VPFQTLWSAAIYRRFVLRPSRFPLLPRFADKREAARQKKGRSATEESGDESPHSKRRAASPGGMRIANWAVFSDCRGDDLLAGNRPGSCNDFACPDLPVMTGRSEFS